ncbi:MAG: hypothetical protein JWN46_3539 [Acidimicrobiales bacterium]|nr:hypothetical protein [Acidimicrobiales bacterium]
MIAARLGRLALVTLIASLSGMLPSGAARAAGAQAAAAPGPTIELLGQTTWVAADGAFFAGLRITGAPAGADVVVSIHRAVTGRSSFDESIPDVRRGTKLATFPVILLDRQPVDPAGGRSVSVLIPVNAPGSAHRPGSYKLDQAAVYPLRIVVRDRDGTELSHVVTHLIRLPTASEATDPSARLRVAPLLSLDAPPTLQPDGRSQRPATELDRIATLVDAVATRPKLALTLDPTPEVVASLTRSKVAADATLLRRLRAVERAGNRQLVSSTYVRVDAAAWTGSGLASQLGRQRVRGTSAINDALGRPDAGTWVADPDLAPSTITALRETGVDQLVVPEANLAPIDPTRFPDDVTQPFKVNSDTGVPTPTLQVDARLRSGFTRTADPRLGAHQLIAELAAISFAQDGTPGAVVLSPPVGWVPSKAFLGEVFDALTSDNPLMVTSTVDQVFSAVPPAGANGAPAQHSGDRGGDLVRTLAPEPPPSLGAYRDRLVQTQVRLTAYGSMVDTTNPLAVLLAERIDVSAARSLTDDQRTRYLDVVDGELERRFGAITAPAKEKVTLAARDASFPLSLRSSLPYPVKVLIQLDASDRLTFPNGNQMVVVLRGARTRVKLHVRAVSGDTPLRVTVRSADGTTILPAATTRYTVRSTAVSGVGIVLTAGAALFLLLWWGSHWRSSRRPARHAKRRGA